MYNYLSKKIVNKLIDMGTIEKDDYEIYIYGFKLIISLCCSLAFILCLSLFINMVSETLFFLLGFLFTRTICGGYHAKHFYSCFISTNIIYISFIGLSFFIDNQYTKQIAIIFLIISSLIIFLFSPVNNKNNPMSEYRKKKNRIISKIMSIILIIISIFICVDKQRQANLLFPIICGIFLASCTIIAAITKNKWEGDEKNEKSI